MLVPGLLALLLRTALASTLSFDGYTLTQATTQALAIDHLGSSDACMQVSIHPTGIYHLSTQKAIKTWSTTNPVSINDNYYFPSGPNSTISRFSLTPAENFIYFLNTANKTILKYRPDTSTMQLSYFAKYSYTENAVPSDFFATQAKSYLYLPMYTALNDSILRVSPTTFSTKLRSYNASLSFSPDRKVAALINPDSTVFLYSLSGNISIINTYPPPSTMPAKYLTNKVKFDNTSTVFIIQYDSYGPITVYNISSTIPMYTYSHADTIYGVSFLQSSLDYLLILGQSGNYLLDTRDSNIYPVSQLDSSTVYDTDYNNVVYQCSNNVLKEVTFTFTPPAVPSPYYIDLFQSQIQKKTTDGVGNAIIYTIDISKNFAMFSTSTPLAIYFLGFINFFTLSSLYVLINFAFPKNVYTYLSFIFDSLNGSILQLMGIQYKFEPISQQKIKRPKPLEFGITSDLPTFNSDIFMTLVTNSLVLLLLQFIFSRVRKTNFLRKVFNDNKYSLVYGQIINALISFTLPWSFLLLKSTGFRTFGSKINSVFLLGTLFIAVHFPIIYFFLLVKEQKEIILAHRKEDELERKQKQKEGKYRNEEEQLQRQAKKRSSKELQTIRVLKFLANIDAKNEKPKKLTFGDYVTTQVLMEWLICLANFVYPFLVLLESPLPFLIIVSIFTFINLVIAFKQIKREKNSFVLTIYPFVFHMCFMVFYFCSSNDILVYTEIICLIVLLIGSLHNTISMLVSLLHAVYKIIKRMCKSSQIKPKRKQKQQNQSTKDKDSKQCKVIKKASIEKPDVINPGAQIFQSIFGQNKPERLEISHKENIFDMKEQIQDEEQVRPKRERVTMKPTNRARSQVVNDKPSPEQISSQTHKTNPAIEKSLKIKRTKGLFQVKWNLMQEQ